MSKHKHKMFSLRLSESMRGRIKAVILRDGQWATESEFMRHAIWEKVVDQEKRHEITGAK